MIQITLRAIPIWLQYQFGIASNSGFSFCVACGRSISLRSASPTGPAFSMIVCSCNVLSDHDVRSAVSAGGSLPRNAKQLYGGLGCSVECGRCVRTIKTIIDETLGPCAKSCCAGCPHTHGVAEEPAQTEFALAAC
jgi:bacterioferritin-associated ferredoxin